MRRRTSFRGGTNATIDSYSPTADGPITRISLDVRYGGRGAGKSRHWIVYIGKYTHHQDTLHSPANDIIDIWLRQPWFRRCTCPSLSRGGVALKMWSVPTHLLRFSGPDMPTNWATRGPVQYQWLAPPPRVLGIDLAAAGAVASIQHPYMPSESAMELIRKLIGKRRYYGSWIARGIARGPYAWWGGMAPPYVASSESARLVPRAGRIPTPDEIESRSTTLRGAADADAKTKITLDISTREDEEPTTAINEVVNPDSEYKFEAVVKISMNAAGVLYLGDSFMVDGAVRDDLCCLAMGFLTTNWHAWDRLTPHYLYVLDRWLLNLDVRGWPGINEFRSVITELLELALGVRPPFLNHQTGFYTIIPGDFRIYGCQFMRKMPQMPGASGPPRYYGLSQPAHDHSHEREGTAFESPFTEVFRPHFLITKGQGWNPKIQSLFSIPADQAAQANAILWDLEEAFYLSQTILKLGPRDASASRPFSSQHPVARPRSAPAYMVDAARHLRAAIPDEIQGILEFESAGETRHRTVVGGITVYRALRDARLGVRRPVHDIVLLTTRSPLEILAMLTRIGFELVDPEHRALTDLYGVAGFLHGRNLFKGSELSFQSKEGHVRISVEYLKMYLPEPSIDKPSAAAITLFASMWISESDGAGWIHGPGIPDQSEVSPRWATIYSIRHVNWTLNTTEKIYRHIRELALDGCLPHHLADVQGTTSWTDLAPTNLADAHFYATHADPSLWQAPFYAKFMENHAMWRDAARATPRSEHYRLRAEFEVRDREILVQYLRAGAELMERSKGYDSLIVEAARQAEEDEAEEEEYEEEDDENDEDESGNSDW
jgi:hypothetical protein